MRQTVTNMLGTLPAQFFEVTVTTMGENLAQLMYSVMMTGYMFRNAQYRMELGSSMAALPSTDASAAQSEKVRVARRHTSSPREGTALARCLRGAGDTAHVCSLGRCVQRVEREVLTLGW
jgi:hypothetical protein